MQTAASLIHEAYQKRPQSPAPSSPLPNENTNHYLWYPAEDIPCVEATGGYTFMLRERARQLGIRVDVPSGFIERCRVAPVLAWPVWERAMDVPSELRVMGRGETPNGDYTEYLYHVPPGHIFNNVMEQYKGWGVTELRALVGMEIGQYLELQIDETYFPMEKDRNKFDAIGKLLDEVPKLYTEIEQRITRVTNDLPQDSRRNTIEGVALDMLQAVEISRAFDVALVEEEETRQPLKYSHHGLRALTRLGRKRRDHALNEMAARQDLALTALPEMFKEISKSNQQTGFSAEQFSEFATTIAAKIAEQFAPLISGAKPQPAPQASPNQPQPKRS